MIAGIQIYRCPPYPSPLPLFPFPPWPFLHLVFFVPSLFFLGLLCVLCCSSLLYGALPFFGLIWSSAALRLSLVLSCSLFPLARSLLLACHSPSPGIQRQSFVPLSCLPLGSKIRRQGPARPPKEGPLPGPRRSEAKGDSPSPKRECEGRRFFLGPCFFSHFCKNLKASVSAVFY